MKPPAPGTLSNEEQKKLMTQVLALIRAAYGEDAQCALAVLKYVKLGDHHGLAMFTMGSTNDPKSLEAAFTIAAQSVTTASIRKLAIETGDPEQRQ